MKLTEKEIKKVRKDRDKSEKIVAILIVISLIAQLVTALLLENGNSSSVIITTIIILITALFIADLCFKDFDLGEFKTLLLHGIIFIICVINFFVYVKM